MELEDVQSDLHALKKLYGLLQFKGNNINYNNSHKNAVASQNLDEKAKLVLKKLLDGATKQIISEEQTKLQSLVTPDTLSNTSPIEDEIPKDSEKDTNCYTVTSQTRKRCRVCGKNRDRDHRHHRTSSEHHYEVSSTRPIKGLEPKETAKGIDHSKKPKLNKLHHDVQSNRGITGSHAMQFKFEPGYKSFKQNENKKPEKTVADVVQRFQSSTKGVDLIKDKDLIATKHQSNVMKDDGAIEMNGSSQDGRFVGVAEAIQRIEARIRANQQMLTHRVVDTVKDMNAMESKYQSSNKKSQLLETKDVSTQKYGSHLASQKDRIPNYTNNALPAKNAKSHTCDILLSESVNEIRKAKEATSTMDQKPHENRYKLSLGMNDLPIQKKSSQARKPVRDKNELQSHMASLSSKPAIDRVHSPSQKSQKNKESTLPTQILSQTNTMNRTSQRKTGGPSRTASVLPRVVGPTPLKADRVGPPPKKNLIQMISQQRPLDVNHKLNRRTEYDMPRQRIILPTLLDGTHRNAPLGPHKKQMPHQQNHSISDSESASCSSRTGSTTQGSWNSSASSSESERDPQPRRMMTRHQNGPISQYTSAHMGPNRERPRPVEHDSIVGQSRIAGPTTITRSNNRISSEKEVGRLRRFKNKLGIIFHHHHHHHHHHHDGDQVGHHTPDHRSFWKYLSDMVHHNSNKDNAKRSTVKKMPRQNQHGYLHTLVDGFLRHVRHSKKSKKSQADIKRFGKTGSHKRKGVVKKWHWWQKLYQKGPSNSGKKRVKVGFRAKRPLLRAPKPD